MAFLNMYRPCHRKVIKCTKLYSHKNNDLITKRERLKKKKKKEKKIMIGLLYLLILLKSSI